MKQCQTAQRALRRLLTKCTNGRLEGGGGRAPQGVSADATAIDNRSSYKASKTEIPSLLNRHTSFVAETLYKWSNTITKLLLLCLHDSRNHENLIASKV